MVPSFFVPLCVALAVPIIVFFFYGHRLVRRLQLFMCTERKFTVLTVPSGRLMLFVAPGDHGSCLCTILCVFLPVSTGYAATVPPILDTRTVTRERSMLYTMLPVLSGFNFCLCLICCVL